MPDLLQAIPIPCPTKGLMDGLESALPGYPPEYCPELENIRTHLGLWQTRLGMSRWTSSHAQSLPAAAAQHFLSRFYRSDGTRVSLAAAGGTLYERENAAAGWSAVSGGTGLGTSPQNGVYHSVTAYDYVYLTDRDPAHNLKRYHYAPPGVLEDVLTLTAPASAPGTRRRIYGVLEAWAGTAGNVPTGYVESDNGNFDAAFQDTTSDTVPSFPCGGNVVKLTADSSGSKNDTVGLATPTAADLNSKWIIFYAWQETDKDNIFGFEYGVNGAAEFSKLIAPPQKQTQFMVVVEVGNLPTIRYRQFRVQRVPNQARDLFVSKLLLPGKLFGKYRYCYTHRRKDTGEESEPSPATEFVDCSAVPVDGRSLDTAVLEKSVEITVESDAGANANTTQIKIYQNGGVPNLTVDELGQEVWVPIATIPDLATELATLAAVGATSVTLKAVQVGAGSNQDTLEPGDWLVFQPGVAGMAEFAQVDTVDAGTGAVTLKSALLYSHPKDSSVQAAWLANQADEVTATSLERLQVERDSPPPGIHWLAKAPDGRLWAFRYSGRNLGVAVSNIPTVDRPLDHQVFPDVSPLTRNSPTQGFRFNVAGDAAGDEIVWGGFFQGYATVLTKRAVYRISAYSQSEWGPTAVIRVLDNVGCAAGETVREIGGWLYWVADGPRVVRWNGAGEPEEVSYLRLPTLLRSAPSAYFSQWFAVAHSDADGPWYRLCLTPAGATTNTTWLDYAVAHDAWQKRVHYDADGTALAWATAVVWDGGADAREVYSGQGGATGQLYQHETGSDDAGQPIRVRATTRKFLFDPAARVVGCIHWLYLRLLGRADSLTWRVRLGGSEYRDAAAYAATDGDPFQDYPFSLANTSTGDLETRARAHHGVLKGRWHQHTLSGSVSNRPAPRDLSLQWAPVREGRVG
ncbi:MAG TPA: hypothetical protein VFU47_16210 [Armatimonadota bacterium]|nr:hypothetical protein [Armatimonadota bacterium]